MLQRLFVGIALLVCTAAPAVAFDPGQLDAPNLKRLVGGGQIVFVEERPNGRLKLVTGGTYVRATPDQVWGIITDYSAYPEWMPQTSEVTVSNRQGDAMDVRFKLDFQFSVITKHVEYTVRHRWTDNRQINWTQVSGDFKTAVGSWKLIPADGGTATLVFFSTYTDLESMGWIITKLIKEQPSMEVAIQGSTALMVVKSVKQRAEGG